MEVLLVRVCLMKIEKRINEDVRKDCGINASSCKRTEEVKNVRGFKIVRER